MIRIVIADDHPIVREGLKQMLSACVDFTIVGEACNGHEVITRTRELEFDVLLLDMSMPGRGGIELIRQVKSEKPRLRVLVLSMHEEEQYAVRSIRAGASGYLNKETAPAQLVSAIRKVASGGAFVTPAVAEQLAMGAMPHAQGLPHSTLSDREFQVMGMLVAGKSITDIAGELNLSVKTVSTHKTRLMQKMGMTNQADLIRYAMENNLA